MEGAHVLLTDGQQRKSLAVVRALGRQGISCDCGEETFFATTRWSRYLNRALVYPSPVADPGAFGAWLHKRVQTGAYEVLFPMDDAVLAVVAQQWKTISLHVRIPIPSPHVVTVAADKGMAARAAARAGLHVPRTLEPATTDEALLLAGVLGYPLVIKARQASGGRGLAVVRSPGEFRGIYDKIHHKYPRPLLQQLVMPGPKYDVCVLMNRRSQARAVFVQKELRHFPLETGTSTLQESVPPCPQLVDMAVSLLEQLGWQGVAELEFMVDPRDGRPYFLEVNPRFWASLQLAIAAGVNFPFLLYQVAMTGDCPEVRQYQVGLRCRWLLPGDILHFAANPNRWRMDPPFWSLGAPNTVWDIIDANDPGPVLGFGLAAFRYLFSARMWRFLLRR